MNINTNTIKRLSLALACALAMCQACGVRAQVAPQVAPGIAVDVDRGFGLPSFPVARAPYTRKRSQELVAGPTLRFMVLGDWGNGSLQQKDVAEAMARYSDAHPGRGLEREGGVDFVILTGDNFYESGVASVDDPQWQERFESIYDPARLPMPFLAVLGNHDWVLDPLAEMQYPASRPPLIIDRGGVGPAKNPDIVPGTRWEMDGFWYQRTFGHVGEFPGGQPLADFFFIDTDLWTLGLGALADKQMAWLESGLKNSKAKWQFVVAHHPLYSDGEHGHEGDITMLRDKLSPVFQKWGVDAFLCGHDHDLQHIEIAGLPTSFVVSGAGGKLRPRAHNDFGPFYVSTPGFVAITLSAQTMQAQVIDAKSQVLHEWQRSPALPAP